METEQGFCSRVYMIHITQPFSFLFNFGFLGEGSRVRKTQWDQEWIDLVIKGGDYSWEETQDFIGERKEVTCSKPLNK